MNAMRLAPIWLTLLDDMIDTRLSGEEQCVLVQSLESARRDL
jgi:hypothetical protein